MKLRIGNTINIKFTITRAGTPYDLRDKNLLLVVKNKIKNTEVILHYPAFSITGADHNVIFWIFQGNEQVYTGKYMLTLYENKGLDNMLAVDCCDAFELVNYTCDTDNETSCGNVEVETIELAADVLIDRTVQSDYSVTNPNDPAYIRNKLTLGTLAEKSVVDIADINATGTPSSSTTLHGDGTWKASGVWGSISGDISSQTDLKNAFDTKVDNSRVLTDAPDNAKFTDTTYSEITETEIDAGTAATLRTITARRITFILGKVTTMISNAISALTKTDVGLSNVDNVKQIPLSQKGSNNGVAELDASGKVPANQLPSFVDDVLEFANLASFPQPGEADKIYVDKATNKTYRWGGSEYVQLNEGVVLGETITTAYRGDRGKIAYDHSQAAHAPADAQKNSDITKAEIEAKLTGNITSHSHSSYVPTSRTVAGKALTGNITLAKGDVGLGNVDNTSDASKPISTAQQAALDDKENITNKVQALSTSSTHDQYPTAKCIYDMIGNLETLLAAI